VASQKKPFGKSQKGTKTQQLKTHKWAKAKRRKQETREILETGPIRRINLKLESRFPWRRSNNETIYAK